MNSPKGVIPPPLKYVPHESVRNHPRFRVHENYLEDMTVEQAADYIFGWRSDNFSKTVFASFYAAVEWDLKTHYGITDEQLS